MTENEINTFIETLEEIGDVWTPEQVKEVYGDYTLDAAIAERKSECSKLMDILGKAINK